GQRGLSVAAAWGRLGRTEQLPAGPLCEVGGASRVRGAEVLHRSHRGLFGERDHHQLERPAGLGGRLLGRERPSRSGRGTLIVRPADARGAMMVISWPPCACAPSVVGGVLPWSNCSRWCRSWGFWPRSG